MKTVVVGCGYLGGRIAQQCLDGGGSVSAIVRSEASAKVLVEQGIKVQMANLDAALPALDGVAGSQLFYFAPPPRTGTEEVRVKNTLAALQQSSSPAKLVYLSTTGVYGDCGGAWVDEAHELQPVAERAQRRCSAEQQVLAWGQRMDVPVVIIRVAGIYGPGRLPLARLKRGEPMVCEAESPYTNRIYIDDLVTVCRAAMERGKGGQVYNVSDGHPGNMTDYFNQVADFAGLPRPAQISLKQAQQQLTAGMLSYLKESRRLDNSKMLKQLAVKLKYPTLQLGLKAIAQVESN